MTIRLTHKQRRAQLNTLAEGDILYARAAKRVGPNRLLSIKTKHDIAAAEVMRHVSQTFKKDVVKKDYEYKRISVRRWRALDFEIARQAKEGFEIVHRGWRKSPMNFNHFALLARARVA